MSKATRYAPPNADGLKPWVVTISSFGRSHDSIVYAASSAEAKYRAVARRPHTYGKVRRATPGDLESVA